jgi:hypothetical protein
MKISIVLQVCMAVLFATLMTGCSTTNPAISSTRAEPLHLEKGKLPDLKEFTVVTVKPFDTNKAKDTEPSVGVKFAEEIARRLKYDFGPLFVEVNMGNPSGATNELIVTGEITKYAPGDKAMRGILIGLGAASFNGDLCLKNSDTQLIQVPFDKLWAWGGTLGMSKGIEDMEAETAASIVNTVARQKGWTPQPRK